ncbi:hypothetical protein scyTo_0006277 [Scyliorhinus torazame]|uniref:HTH CENPB-type domain-containing protein n=1 Tax=Scyliorhinus torazame TaxID=75743 RepID=A0A401PGY2_SCYTO|nr:hypothetical protein [Scyliorhinus torazame]
MRTRKTLHKVKTEDLDRVMKEWIRQRWTEQMPLNGLLIMKQAKIYHDELGIEGEKRVILDLLTHAKGTPSNAINKLKEMDIEEVLNIDNEAVVVHSMTDGEMAEMVLNQGDRVDNSEDNIVSTREQVPTDGENV